MNGNESIIQPNSHSRFWGIFEDHHKECFLIMWPRWQVKDIFRNPKTKVRSGPELFLLHMGIKRLCTVRGYRWPEVTYIPWRNKCPSFIMNLFYENSSQCHVLGEDVHWLPWWHLLEGTEEETRLNPRYFSIVSMVLLSVGKPEWFVMTLSSQVPMLTSNL